MTSLNNIYKSCTFGNREKNAENVIVLPCSTKTCVSSPTYAIVVGEGDLLPRFCFEV